MRTRSFVALLLTICLTVPAPLLAATIGVPRSSPAVTVRVPDDWKTGSTKRGTEFRTPDEEVVFWIEIYDRKDAEEVLAEHKAFYAKQGVEVGGTAKRNTEKTQALTITASDYTATWKGAPTVLRYMEIDSDLLRGRQILMSYWASPAGDKTYREAVGDMLTSLDIPK